MNVYEGDGVKKKESPSYIRETWHVWLLIPCFSNVFKSLIDSLRKSSWDIFQSKNTLQNNKDLSAQNHKDTNADIYTYGNNSVF